MALNTLTIDKKELARSAERFGAPLYLYDFDGVIQRLESLRDRLDPRIEIYYAVKANPNRRILEHLRSLVDGLDVSSGGEIRQALLSGYQGFQMSFAGPGKSEAEVVLALQEECGSISIESVHDLERILRVSQTTSRIAKVSLRLNPRLLTKSFALKMGGRPTQFGVDEEELGEISALIRSNHDRLDFRGYHVYSGTQSLDAVELVANYAYTLEMSDRIARETGLPAGEINMGGGLGIPYYPGQEAVDLEQVVEGINRLVEKHARNHPQIRYRIELGRYIIGEFGYYICRVVAIKSSRGKKYLILDGGMHQNLSASGNLGQVIRRNYPVENISSESEAVETVEITGCLCTPVDLLAANCQLSRTRVGDLIAFGSSGAYGLTASPLFFLGHETPKEVLIRGGKSELIRGPRDITVLN